jgi:hypothetical protein
VSSKADVYQALPFKLIAPVDCWSLLAADFALTALIIVRYLGQNRHRRKKPPLRVLDPLRTYNPKKSRIMAGESVCGEPISVQYFATTARPQR